MFSYDTRQLLCVSKITVKTLDMRWQ